jgi:hypothetical protein
VAIPGVGEVEGVAAGEAAAVGFAAGDWEMDSCAVTTLVIKRTAPNAIRNFLMKVCFDKVFKIGIGCGVRDLGEAG